jgi:ABC-type siderophore export system fused ATPase/permease subunit
VILSFKNSHILVGRQNDDVNVISDVMKNSFNTTVKAIVYIILCLAYLVYLSPKLIGILLGGLVILSVFSGGLRRQTSQLNKAYLAEKAKLA